MKIGIFSDLNVLGGGIFQQTMGYIDSADKAFRGKIKTVLIVNSSKTSNFLKSQNIKHLYFNKKNLYNKIYFYLLNFTFFQKFFNRFKIINPFEKYIKHHEIDLLIFASPSYYVFYSKGINYVLNIWNTEIKKFNFFPEFKRNLSYESQDNIISEGVKNSFKIISFSKKNEEDLVNFYSCPKEKILSQIMIPHLPKVYEKVIDKKEIENFNFSKDIKSKFIFLYPAQFYPHKNHKFLLDVVSNIKKKTSNDFVFIFTGRDKGNLNYLKKKVEEYKIKNDILFYENLHDKQLIELYLKCDALISSTFLGRISLPLLEAFYFKKPIFYSKDILDPEFEKRVVAFDLKNVEDLSSKLIDFMNNNQKFEKLITENKYFYDQNCNYKLFKNNYLKLISDFNFYLEKWK
tara:strand:+ start:18183 stop:19391 length:1209 start_codon:yes stop_codon:yes gene_type:complete